MSDIAKEDCLRRQIDTLNGKRGDQLIANCDRFELVTHSNGELEESDFEAFGEQCGKFTKTICGICHDRFIIIDQKEIFWMGASLKDAGRLTFAAAKMGAEVIPGLLESIRKATSEQREYGKGKKVAAKAKGKP